MPFPKRNDDLFNNLHIEVKEIMDDQSIDPEKRKQQISQKLKTVKKEVGDRSAHQFINELHKIRNIFLLRLKQIESIGNESASLLSLLSQIHDYIGRTNSEYA